MKNLKFHSTLKFINRNFSFVVQDHNVHEINEFVKLIESIYDYNQTPYTITFRAIQDWNHQYYEDYKVVYICCAAFGLVFTETELIKAVELFAIGPDFAAGAVYVGAYDCVKPEL